MNPLADLEVLLRSHRTASVLGAFILILAGVDLAVTIDTAVAHLAGALGLPTWILLKRGADWRWMLDRDDSPWYPTARLVRQQELGVWDDVILKVRAALDRDFPR